MILRENCSSLLLRLPGNGAHDRRLAPKGCIVISMTERAVVLSLQNRVALVTGGSRGIGAAIVRLFVQAGAQVAFNYQRARDQAEKLAEECGGKKRCLAVAAELSS